MRDKINILNDIDDYYDQKEVLLADIVEVLCDISEKE